MPRDNCKKPKVFDGKHGSYDRLAVEYTHLRGGTVPKRRKTVRRGGSSTSFIEKIQDSDNKHSVVKEHAALSFYNTLSAGAESEHQFAPSARLGMLNRDEFEQLLEGYLRNYLEEPTTYAVNQFKRTALNREKFYESRAGEKRYLTFKGKLVPGYNDLGPAFVGAIEQFKTIPAFIEHENEILPLQGLLQIAALSRILKNNDWLGGSGGNTGYVIKNGVAQAIMVDAGESLPSCEGALNKVPMSERAFPIGNNSEILVQFDSLSPEQQDEFIGTIYKYLHCEDIPTLLQTIVKKGGLYNSKQFSNGEVIETLPEDMADEWIADIVANLVELCETYQQELDDYANRHPDLPEEFSLADFGVDLERADTECEMISGEELASLEEEQSTNVLYNLLVVGAAVVTAGAGAAAVTHLIRNN